MAAGAKALSTNLCLQRGDNDDNPVLPGLIDVEKLRYDGNRSGLQDDKSGSSRPEVGGISGGGRGKQTPVMTHLKERFERFPGKNTSGGPGESESVVIVAAGGRQ